MRVARSPSELGPGPRAVALGTFDGVHLGHRRVLEAALEAGPEPTVVTFDPHPRTALGNRVELLTTLERRLELLDNLGVAAVLVVDFTLELARLEPEEFAEEVLRAIGAETVVAGADFRFGRGRKGDLALLGRLGFDVRPVPLLPGVSSSRIRELVRSGAVEDAAQLLGRPVEVDGTVVTGDALCPAAGSTPAPQRATAPRSRSAPIRTTAAGRRVSRPFSSTSRATSTAGASSSSSGSGCVTSGRSRTRTSSLPRSTGTSRRQGPRNHRLRL